jgi:serine/threonine protein phosphatase PrpC
MASDARHPRIRQRSAMRTDVGVIRDHNEDAAYADPEGDFFIVADGMGGHAAGEVASKMAVEAVTSALEKARGEIGEFARAPTDQGRRSLVSALENAVRQAHQSVYQRGAAETDKQGMGTTLDVVLIAGSEAFVAHVGDSRTYLVRDRRAAQITTDHTVAEVLVIEGKLSIEEAQISPLRTILVNAIGVAPDVGVEMAHVRLRAGDRLLLCSDGLHDYFPLEQEVSDYVSENEPDEALVKMVGEAKKRGGHDNITGIVLEVIETSDVAESGDEELESPRRVGYEDTGNMPAVAEPEGIPDEISRDDTAPTEEKQAEKRDAAAARNGAAESSESDEKKSEAEPEPEAAKAESKAKGDKDPTDGTGKTEQDSAKKESAKKDSPSSAESKEAASTSAADKDPAEAAGKRGRRRGRNVVGDRNRKDIDDIENADTDELPAEPGEESAPRSRSD